jgi:hypothetical protein
MPFDINPDREYVFDYEIKEGDWIQVTFDFPWSEEMDYTTIRTLLKDVPEFEKNEKIKKLKSGKTITKSDAAIIEESKSIQVYYNLLRTSLVGCAGFQNSRDKSEIKIKDSSGGVIEKNQKAIFEFVKKTPKLFEKVSLAYAGELDSKNVKLGLQPVSSMDGTQENVTPVT